MPPWSLLTSILARIIARSKTKAEKSKDTRNVLPMVQRFSAAGVLVYQNFCLNANFIVISAITSLFLWAKLKAIDKAVFSSARCVIKITQRRLEDLLSLITFPFVCIFGHFMAEYQI
jgi:hypothetical protein